MRRPIPLVAGVVLALVPLAARNARAQQRPAAPGGQCQLQFSARNTTSPPRVNSVRQPSGQYNSFVGGGVIARCPAQSMTLIADSAEYYGDRRLLHLIGNVHYTEPRLTLDSDLADYFMAEERLEADGRVHARLPSGTTLDGPHIQYLRAAPGIRPEQSMTAPGRPTIRVVEADSSGKPAEPMTVVANVVTMHGDSLVFASGKVDITRTDVLAHSDSAWLDSGREFARLVRSPSITARGDRPFTLTGQVIDLYGRSRALERVLSQGKAKGVSQDATLTADTLDFAMAGGRLQRVHAWGKSRARATNPTYDIVADSLDVRMPEQRLREIRALRDAFAQSVPDTTKIHTTEHDWLRGDTVYAYFDSTRADSAARADSVRAAAGRGTGAPADSSRQPRITELRSLGHARSFYQLAAKDTAAIGPAVNYVRGERITVTFENRQVQQVAIAGQSAGVYLDPSVPGATDTTGAPATPANAAPARPRRPRRGASPATTRGAQPAAPPAKAPTDTTAPPERTT
ncbi:MAG TPA: hypothetical protein VFS44_04495 [Gemmatimonadaceae bacterium]|nr:hypothetical protein [Gemmatimonadaceae bacterium]